jgi:hypothetical protein
MWIPCRCSIRHGYAQAEASRAQCIEADAGCAARSGAMVQVLSISVGSAALDTLVSMPASPAFATGRHGSRVCEGEHWGSEMKRLIARPLNVGGLRRGGECL